MFELLALIFAALWIWSLVAANPLGGFLHVLLVLAVVSACHRCFRRLRSSSDGAAAEHKRFPASQSIPL